MIYRDDMPLGGEWPEAGSRFWVLGFRFWSLIPGFPFAVFRSLHRQPSTLNPYPGSLVEAPYSPVIAGFSPLKRAKRRAREGIRTSAPIPKTIRNALSIGSD